MSAALNGFFTFNSSQRINNSHLFPFASQSYHHLQVGRDQNYQVLAMMFALDFFSLYFVFVWFLHAANKITKSLIQNSNDQMLMYKLFYRKVRRANPSLKQIYARTFKIPLETISEWVVKEHLLINITKEEVDSPEKI